MMMLKVTKIGLAVCTCRCVSDVDIVKMIVYVMGGVCKLNLRVICTIDR